MNNVAAIKCLLDNNLQFRAKVSIEEGDELLKGFNIKERPLFKSLAYAIGPMKFNGGDPNNGNFNDIVFQIGNENSMVIYFNASIYCRKVADIERIEDNIRFLANTYKADEISIEFKPVEICGEETFHLYGRLWWD